MTGYFSYTQVKRVANNSEDGRKKISFFLMHKWRGSEKITYAVVPLRAFDVLLSKSLSANCKKSS